MNTFRDNGAIGALLDEYEKSVNELKEVISLCSTNDLFEIVDRETTDKDCESIQSILTHVVGAGYNYVVEIRRGLGETTEFKEKMLYTSVAAYSAALDKMFAYNLQLFEDHPTLQLEEYDSAKKIKVRWGQRYDPEQLIEHAIVHILRHRRQIERFQLKLKA
ncbi:MAG: DinB family protein [Saprospiraceae bacterium]